VLFAASLVLFVTRRMPQGGIEGAYETLGMMACLTGFLAFAWWRARSGSREFSRELDRYLRDLAG